jgi:hypothetical protein
MSLVIKAERGGIVPDGLYSARLSDVKQFSNAWGERIGFEFTLLGLEGVDQKVMRSTAAKLTPDGKLAEMIKSITGQSELPQEIDLEALIGAKCRVVIKSGTNQQGITYSNVEAVIPDS